MPRSVPRHAPIPAPTVSPIQASWPTPPLAPARAGAHAVPAPSDPRASRAHLAWCAAAVATVTALASLSPSPASAQAQAAPVNSVDTILDDMRLMNDARLAGVNGTDGWRVGPGHVVMGADPRGTATPWWWNPSNRALKSTQWWRALVGWMAVFDGVGNAASNTRVEMRGMRTYVRSARTGRWTELAAGPIEGALYPKNGGGGRTGRVDVRNGAGDVRSLRPDPNAMFHGWISTNGMADIEPSDVAAVHVTLEARLAVDDASRADDRGRALYLLQVGADYYPTRSTDMAVFAPTGYNPGVGVSRSKRIRDDWQAFSFTTVDVGRVETNGRAMTEAELRADPPPVR